MKKTKDMPKIHKIQLVFKIKKINSNKKREEFIIKQFSDRKYLE